MYGMFIKVINFIKVLVVVDIIEYIMSADTIIDIK